MSIKSVKYVRIWNHTQRKIIEKYMDKAQRILYYGGFLKSNVHMKIQNRKKGIARDIIKEAKGDYDLVIARRRGAGIIRGILLGNVARKLLEGLSTTPIIIAGKCVPENKFLVAVDGSEGSTRAIELVGVMLQGKHIELSMVHVIRDTINQNGRYGPLKTTNDFVENSKIRIKGVFEDYRTQLIRSGFEENQIHYKIITEKHSRAHTIAEEAKEGNFGTIVLGRKGLSNAKDFTIGRVTNKVIHLAKDRTIWITT